MSKIRYTDKACRQCDARGWVQTIAAKGWPVVCKHCRGAGKEPDTRVDPDPIPVYTKRQVEGGYVYDPAAYDK